MNLDCIRDILLCIESKQNIKIENISKVLIQPISLLELCNNLNDKYLKEEVWYNSKLLIEANFINMREGDKKKQTYQDFEYLTDLQIYSISYTGHQFLETIRPKTVWEQTKKVVTKTGSSALQFVASTAQIILAECAKQAIASFISGGSAPM